MTLQLHEGMPHDFMLFPGSDEASICIEKMCALLRSALAWIGAAGDAGAVAIQKKSSRAPGT